MPLLLKASASKPLEKDVVEQQVPDAEVKATDLTPEQPAHVPNSNPPGGLSAPACYTTA